MGTGVLDLLQADKQLRTISVPTFTASAQQQLDEELKESNVQYLLTMDYEVYGVLEALEPRLHVQHSWAAVSHERRSALPQLLTHAAGGHLIVLKATHPMIYNLRATEKQLQKSANKLDLQIKLVDAWPS